MTLHVIAIYNQKVNYCKAIGYNYDNTMSDKLASEKVVVSAPASFAGSAQRLWKITNSETPALKWLILVPVALLLIMIAWTFVAMWYIVIFGLFGIFVIPFRLWTRGSRKRKRQALQHRELLEAIRDQKA